MWNNLTLIAFYKSQEWPSATGEGKMKGFGEEIGGVREGAARLRCGRKSRSLSVSKACAALGIAPATLKRWEAGTGTPCALTIDRILETWGLPKDSALKSEKIVESLGRKVSWSIEQAEPRPVLRLLRHRRRRSRLSLEDVANATGVGLASLQRYETGLRIPTCDLLDSISAAVGCTGEESGLLKESLASSEPASAPIEVAEMFSLPNGNPGFYIFRELDFLCRFHELQSEDEIEDRLRSVMLGLAFSGDYSALVEAWQASRAFVRKRGAVGTVQGLVAMARMHLAKRPKDAINDFVEIRKQVPETPTTSAEINATFSAIRMAQLLGDHEDADDLLTRVERNPDFGPGADVSCTVYRHMINFSLGESNEAIPSLQSVRKNPNPVLGYTTLVAELNILAKMGRRLDAFDVLQQCEHVERTWGLGSPLARKLGAKLLSA